MWSEATGLIDLTGLAYVYDVNDAGTAVGRAAIDEYSPVVWESGRVETIGQGHELRFGSLVSLPPYSHSPERWPWLRHPEVRA